MAIWDGKQDPGYDQSRQKAAGANNPENTVKNYLANNKGYMDMGQSPYAGDYNDLIAQLKKQMMDGQLSQMQFKQASDQGLANQLAMSHGRSAGAAHTATNNMGQMSQGLSQGMTQAALQERMAASGQLGGVLGGANQADFQRSQANQQAYLDMLRFQMSQPTGWDKLMQFGMGAAGPAAQFSQPRPK